MNKKIALQDIAQQLAISKKISAQKAEKIVRIYFETLSRLVVEEKSVKVKGLGTFKLVDVMERESINIKTGDRITIPGHTKISFSPETALKDMVNKPFANFQTVIINEDTDLAAMEKIPEEADEETPETVDQEPVPAKDEKIADKEPKQDVPEPEASEEADNQAEADISEKPMPAQAEVTNPQETHMENKEKQAAKAVQETSTVTESESLKEKQAESRKIETVVVTKKEVNCWFYSTWFLLTLILMGISYYAGTRGLIGRLETCSFAPNTEKPQEAKPQVEKTHTATEDSIAELQKKAAKEKKRLEAQEEQKKQVTALSEKYPQVPGGKYLIVGVKKTRPMKVGENLYKMAQEEFGDKTLVQYIIVLNNFSDPDRIPKGYEVKIPEIEFNE